MNRRSFLSALFLSPLAKALPAAEPVARLIPAGTDVAVADGGGDIASVAIARERLDREMIARGQSSSRIYFFDDSGDQHCILFDAERPA